MPISIPFLLRYQTGVVVTASTNGDGESLAGGHVRDDVCGCIRAAAATTGHLVKVVVTVGIVAFHKAAGATATHTFEFHGGHNDVVAVQGGGHNPILAACDKLNVGVLLREESSRKQEQARKKCQSALE